jgi:hypothetical protein
MNHSARDAIRPIPGQLIIFPGVAGWSLPFLRGQFGIVVIGARRQRSGRAAGLFGCAIDRSWGGYRGRWMKSSHCSPAASPNERSKVAEMEYGNSISRVCYKLFGDVPADANPSVIVLDVSGGETEAFNGRDC